MRSGGRASVVCVLLSYAAMAFPDAIGIVSERLRLEGFASSLVFVWFLLLSLPAGALCTRIGARSTTALSLVLPLPALAMMALGGEASVMAALGLAFVGAANVVLQVALPARIAEVFGVSRQPGVMTCGLLAKTICAIGLPFLLAFCASLGEWRLFFPAFGIVFAVAALLVLRTGHERGSAQSSVVFRSVLGVVRDIPTLLAAVAFAVGVVADVSFNLSVPDAVRVRFSLGDASVGTVYAVLFGVKIPVTFLGAWLFSRYDARRLFPVSIAIAVAGGLLFFLATGFSMYLAGVALFAAGYANVYGFVFAVASPRHPPEKASAVSSLLVMAICGGALASPMASAMSSFFSSPAEILALVATVLLLGVSLLTCGRGVA